MKEVLKMTSFVILLLFQFQSVKAQNGFSILHDFCTDSAIASALGNSYADTDRFFVLGRTSTAGISPEHGILAAFDYNGLLIWQKKMFFPGQQNSYSSLNAIIKTGSNEYAIAGTVHNPGQKWYQYLYRFTGDGDSILFRSYPDTAYNKYAGAIAYDGHYFITAGNRFNTTIAKNTLWMCKYDSLGNLLWEKDLKYTANNAMLCKVIILPGNGHYVISGNITGQNINDESSGIIETDTSGNIILAKAVPKQYFSENAMDIVHNPSGGYYFVTSTSTTPPIGGAPGYSSIYYGKLKPNGDILWTKTFKDSLVFRDGKQIKWAADGKHLLILAGVYGSSRAGAMKIDTFGNIKWYHPYQHEYAFNKPWWQQPYACDFNSLSVTPDDRYLMVGSAEKNTSTVYSWMILTDADGCRYSNDPACWPVSVSDIENQEQEINIYPNPAINELHVDVEKECDACTIAITDMPGRTLIRSSLPQRKNSIDIRSLPAGLYIAYIGNAQGLIKTVKFLKE